LQEQFFGPQTGLVDPKSDPGAPEPLVKPVSTFVGSASPAVQKDFRNRAEYQYFASPSLRDESGKTMTPNEWVARQVEANNEDALEVPYIQEGVFDYLTSGTAKEPKFEAYSKKLLGQLREQSPGGKEARFPGWTRSERDVAKAPSGQETRYMMSPGLRANLDTQRTLNVLSALQEDPYYRPDWSTTGSSLIALPAAALAGLKETARHAITDAQVTPEDEYSTNNWARGALHLGYLRNLLSAANPAEARMAEATYWDRMADERNARNQYRSGSFGGFGPSESWMTTQGMANEGDKDAANYLTYAENLKNLAFSGVNSLAGGQGQAIQDVIGDLHRAAPLVPEGATTEEVEEISEKLERWLRGEQQKYVAEYPLYQRNWNDSVGQLGDWARVREYSLPSPANESVAMAPKNWIDVPTIATAGVMAPWAIARGGVRSLLAGLAGDFGRDQVTTEQPFSAALYAANPPYSTEPQKLFEAMDPQVQGVVPVFPSEFTDDGQRVMADPNSPDYPKHYERWREGQQKLLEDIIEYHKKYYSPSASNSRGEL